MKSFTPILIGQPLKKIKGLRLDSYDQNVMVFYPWQNCPVSNRSRYPQHIEINFNSSTMFKDNTIAETEEAGHKSRRPVILIFLGESTQGFHVMNILIQIYNCRN